MKDLLKILLTGILLVSALSVNAQYRYQNNPQNIDRSGEIQQNRYTGGNGNSRLRLNLHYGISQPLGSLKDYADKTSFNGWNASLLYEINPKIAAGLGVGFYDYYQKIPRQIYHDGNTDISAVQTHTLQFIPIQPTVVFTPKGDEPGIKPYVGLGIGIADINYAKYWGEFVDQQNKIAFSVSPMAGVRIPFGESSPLGANIGVKYNFAPFKYNEVTNINSVEANVGLSIRFR
jgi:hypothetical protein